MGPSLQRAAAESRPSSVPAAPFSGVVIDSANAYALGGLHVKVSFVEPSATGTAASETLLGDATTDAHGHFAIRLLNTPLVQQRLQLLGQAGGKALDWSVDNGTRIVYKVDHAPSNGARTDGLTLLVTVPAVTLEPQHWRTLGSRIEQASVSQVHELIRSLLSTSPARSLFADWTLEMRYAAAAALEQAFLDPRGVLARLAPAPTLRSLNAPGGLEAYKSQVQAQFGTPGAQEAFDELSAKATSFHSMYDVDWVMEVKSFQTADVATALTKNQPIYEIKHGSFSIGVAQTADYNLINYRNYLRNLFTEAQSSPNFAGYEANLQSRFHQNFTTTNTTSSPANQLAIATLSAVMTAPIGAQYGFGMAVPPQGSQGNRAYLDELISLTGVPAGELEKRYRLNLSRSDLETSSPVQENITALQRFYRDGFQSVADPFPLIPATRLGKAPFYLEYGEWLRLNGPFYGENYYSIRQTFAIIVANDERPTLEKLKGSDYGYFGWFGLLAAIEDKLNDAHNKYDGLQYKQARDLYLEAAKMAREALQTDIHVFGDGSSTLEPGGLAPSEVVAKAQPYFATLKSMQIKAPADLDSELANGSVGSFVDALRIECWSPPSKHWDFVDDLQTMHDQHVFSLLHAYLYLLPVCLGDTATAMGDYPTAVQYYGLATGFTVGRGKLRYHAGYGTWDLSGVELDDFIHGDIHGDLKVHLYEGGDLPYTADVNKPPEFPIDGPDGYPHPEDFGAPVVPVYTHKMERQYCALRQGNAMLDWADVLYRSGDGSGVQRARELYKAVLWLQGFPPDISPTWTAKGPKGYGNQKTNPAVLSHVARASQSLYQIDHGLNYYGFSDDLVPALRYRPLKEAADRYAASAKAAESDFISAMSSLENLVKDGLMNANILKKALVQSQIANEQTALANYDVSVAQGQVDQVNAAIDKKKKEIADHDGFGQQLVDFVSGFVNALTSLPSSLTSGLGSGAAAGAGLTSNFTASGGMFGQGGWLGLGAGASTAGAFGLFVYAGVSSMVGIQAASEQRGADLSTLQNQALPQAEALLAAKQHEVVIAGYQKALAQADADLAYALMYFDATRTLSADFWITIIQVLRRILRRYLELGARYAWLAQRALAYEQDRELEIIRMDYFPANMYGASGAGQLQLDLGELDATRLSGFKQAVPVKQTYSLAFDFPMQFAQLKKNGSCLFRPLEANLRYAYPGLYSYRIRSLTLSVQTTQPTGAIRGLLTNTGVSSISRKNGASHLSARFAEGFPLSEFRMKDDMLVFGLPDETLLNFEGSGIETFWNLEFSSAANPYGLDTAADILLTFDLTANFSPDLYQVHVANPPTALRRFMFVSAIAQNPKAMDDLHGAAPSATVQFDMSKIDFPQHESGRLLKNVVMSAVNKVPLTFNAQFASTAQPVVTTAVNFVTNIAISNAPPLADSNPVPPPSPLNAFVGVSVDQVFNLTVNKAANPSVDFTKVVDIVLGMDYSANLT